MQLIASISSRVTVSELDEQHGVTQLLVHLLPACNSDTLYRLLQFLSTVTDHAHDRLDKDGQEVSCGGERSAFSDLQPWGPLTVVGDHLCLKVQHGVSNHFLNGAKAIFLINFFEGGGGVKQ